MAIVLKKVESAGDIRRFIRFPHQIYSRESPWVAPLDSERKKFLDPEVNPFFDHAEAGYFLALSDNGKILGRIAAIVDHEHNKVHKERTGFFGMFECLHDTTASTLLLNAAERWCREKGMARMMGPMNLSTNHECGLLVENFDDPPVLGIPYNPPYYESLLQQSGLEKLKDLISLTIKVTGIPEYLKRAIPLIEKRNRFSVRTLRMDRFEKEIDRVWEIYNSAWVYNWGFVPMSHQEFIFAASEMKRFVDPTLCFLAEVQGEPVGFTLVLPDINQVLKTMDGKLFPLGWLRFILGRKKIDRYRVITLGIKKKYQRLGVDAYFYYKIYQRCLELKIPVVDMSWVLEDNQAMIAPIERIGGVPYKRHRIYERTCGN